MKKINLLLVALVGAMAISLTSCKDECKDITCENGGTCEEGICACADDFYGTLCETECVNGTYGTSCECDDGYEGDACTVVSREAFLGDYNCDDACESGGYTYEQSVTEGAEITEIKFDNFAGFDVTITANVNGNDLTIPSQTDASGRKYTGTGNIGSSGNTITVDYVVTFSDLTSDDCTTTLTRK